MRYSGTMQGFKSWLETICKLYGDISVMEFKNSVTENMNKIHRRVV